MLRVTRGANRRELDLGKKGAVTKTAGTKGVNSERGVTIGVSRREQDLGHKVGATKKCVCGVLVSAS